MQVALPIKQPVDRQAVAVAAIALAGLAAVPFDQAGSDLNSEAIGMPPTVVEQKAMDSTDQAETATEAIASTVSDGNKTETPSSAFEVEIKLDEATAVNVAPINSGKELTIIDAVLANAGVSLANTDVISLNNSGTQTEINGTTEVINVTENIDVTGTNTSMAPVNSSVLSTKLPLTRSAIIGSFINDALRQIKDSPAMTGESLRKRVVEDAYSWLGTPYRWGGQSRSGADCSGFVQAVFAGIGIELPRTSFEQFRQGVGIARNNLAPGDLVFFSTNGPGASHVGIYIGEGEFISATKTQVEVQSLADPYWNKTYRGSRRVIALD